MHGAVPPLPYVFMPVLLNPAQGRLCLVLVSRVLGCEDYVEKALLNACLWCSCFLIVIFVGHLLKTLYDFFFQNLYVCSQFFLNCDIPRSAMGIGMLLYEIRDKCLVSAA